MPAVSVAALMLQVVPGELTIVTGLSNSGKSEWLDALTVNLARQHGWRIAVCSLENTPVEHGRKLMEKYCGESARAGTAWGACAASSVGVENSFTTRGSCPWQLLPCRPSAVASPAAACAPTHPRLAPGPPSLKVLCRHVDTYVMCFACCLPRPAPPRPSRPLPADKAFFSVADAHDVGKMGYNDVLDGISWIDEHFHLILPPPDEMPSIDYILEKARAAVLRWGAAVERRPHAVQLAGPLAAAVRHCRMG